MYHVFQNNTERLDSGYVIDRDFRISPTAVYSDKEADELIPLKQEMLTRRIADILDSKRSVNSDFKPFALDESGRMYHTPEEMAQQLFSSRKANKLFLFTNKGEKPYCLQQDYGFLTMSKDRITPENQLEREKDKLYTPSRSLDPADMAVSGKKLNYLVEKRSKLKEHLKLYIPQMREDSRIRSQTESSYFSRNKKAPRLGFFSTIGNWFSKTFTGKPSKAYEAYAEKKKEYNAHVKTREMLKRRDKALNEAEKREAA